MKSWTGVLWAILLGVSLEAHAGGALPSFEWSPRFTGKFDAYGFGTDLVGIQARTGPIARGCPFGRVRGARLKVKQQPTPTDPATGFFAFFPDANQKRQPVQVLTLIDVTKLDSAGALAVVELDSPFVPLGTNPDFFSSLVVARQDGGPLVVFVATQAGNVGTPLYLPEDTPTVIGRIVYDGGLVDVDASACDAAAPTNLVTDHPLAFGGSSGLGAGITGYKGDQIGFAFDVTGDLYDAAKQDILEDLKVVIDLEVAALADLGNGMSAEARTKIEQARALLRDQGPPIPATDPQQFEADLIEKVESLPDSVAREEALNRLQKAADRDVKARDKIDQGTPKSLKEAEKQLGKAREEKLRAKAILETGVLAEGMGQL